MLAVAVECACGRGGRWWASTQVSLAGCQWCTHSSTCGRVCVQRGTASGCGHGVVGGGFVEGFVSTLFLFYK